MPGAINKRKMDVAWEILQENPEMKHELIALEIQTRFELSKPPLQTTITHWICNKRKEIKRAKLKEYVNNIATRIIRRNDCRYCGCFNPDSGRCHYAWETEIEIIDLLAEKVFCDYYQARGRMECGSIAGLVLEKRLA